MSCVVKSVITVTTDQAWDGDNARIRKFVHALNEVVENTPGSVDTLTVVETVSGDRYKTKKLQARLRVTRRGRGSSAPMPS